MNSQVNGSSRRERRHFSAAQKAAIVKAHLVDKTPISDLCEQHAITVNQFYQWQKQLFEGTAAAFETRRKVAAGEKPGFSYGATDEFGTHAVEGRMHMNDLHATLLALMGLDHELLTYRYAGRDFRLTDVAGSVCREIFA